MIYRIIVAHPGKQHSFRLASALKKENMLLYYVTTIYDKETSILMKVMKKLLSKSNKKRASSRKNQDLNDNEILQYCELSGMIEAFLIRVDKSYCVYRMFQRFNSDRFGRKVAYLAIKSKANAVVLYDSNALKCFEILKKKTPEVKRIMDISSTARPFRKELYQREIECSGHNDLKRENEYMWNKKLLDRMQKEIEYTQYFLAPSNFVKKSLEYSGVKTEQIYVVPYGTNVNSSIIRKEQTNRDVLHFLFVGNINYNKGVTYLLEAISRIGVNRADLTLTGKYNSSDWFVKRYIGLDNVTFTGRVTFDKMKAIYEKSDVFVIDSFSEGMAQVGLEAMGCGLPIICTLNSGVADLINDGENGFIIPCGDVEALREKMQWFIDHKEKIRVMGEAARRTASKYTWSYYEKNVITAITNILKKNI